MNEITITRMGDITPTHSNEHPKYEFYKHAVTDSAYKYEVSSPREGNQTVAAFYVLPPGKSNYPYHYHTANEEVFYVISGGGVLETPGGGRSVKAGDIVVCPAGKQGAHKITNNGLVDFVYLDVDTNNTPDIAYYPHSNKVGIRHAGGMRDNFKLDGNVKYYDGE